MEEIIVAVLVAGALYWGTRIFKKQLDPDSGCGCSGKCRKCPSSSNNDCRKV